MSKGFFDYTGMCATILTVDLQGIDARGDTGVWRRNHQKRVCVVRRKGNIARLGAVAHTGVDLYSLGPAIVRGRLWLVRPSVSLG